MSDTRAASFVCFVVRNHNRIGDVYGVAKAYVTRVGNGPLPTEVTTPAVGGQYLGNVDAFVGKYLQIAGKEVDAT